ncbi:MAG TPA: hypothetical protein VMV16_04330 [Solirubrobacteraceae bacterium]|nr:hypothetical protein [Solirubrobacteraceae bacterium]
MHTSLQSRGQGIRLHLKPVLLVLLVTLALPASALAAAFKLTPHIANHTPTVNVKWPITVDVTKGKKKLNGSVKYQFLFQGSVVSHQPGHRFTRGVYRDTLLFPSDSLGQQLTLRIIVTTRYGTEHLDWAVKSRQ